MDERTKKKQDLEEYERLHKEIVKLAEATEISLIRNAWRFR